MTGILNLLAGAVGVVKDTYFNLVTLLLPGDGTNGAQNNTFLDSSSSPLTITRNGSTTQGTFSPFSQTGWGNYFGATGNYLSIPYSSAFNLTGDFTVECWINPGNLPSSTGVAPQAFERIFSFGTYNAANSFGFEINSNDASTVRKFIAWYNGTSYALSSNNAVSPGNWYHTALVRSGTTITFYLNGVSTGTITGASASINTSQAFYIASLHAFESDSSAAFNGYISNFRLVKGTAVYTSNFTPSTTPLTAITNTVLLTCQSNRFIDNSASPLTITVNGTPSVQAFSPFAPTAAYSAATNGGSGYFDGNGDYLTVASATALQLSTANNFCIEAWIYPTALANADNGIISKRQSTVEWQFAVNGSAAGASNKQIYLYNNTTAYTSGTTIPGTNTWTHVAVTWDGTTLRFFINGTLCSNTYTSFSLPAASTNSVSIGANGSAETLSGYITDARIVKGSAVYTASFTPPTAPLTAITNTSLLLNFTNAGITDATAKNDLETVGNAQISTTQSKFGGSSMYFDGTGDYLIPSPNAATLNAFGTGDFTVEFWMNSTSFANADNIKIIFDCRPLSTDGVYPTIYFSSGQIRYFVNNADRITGSTLNTGQWYHVALCRSGTSTKLFVDGTQVGSTYTDSNNYLCGANRPVIGCRGHTLGDNNYYGYIDDLRITVGYARYTANFTAPTAPLPVQ